MLGCTFLIPALRVRRPLLSLSGMRSTRSFSRRCALVIVMISPALMGYFKCVAVSNPSVAVSGSSVTTAARIDNFEPSAPRVGEIVNATGTGNGTPPLQFIWDFGDGTDPAVGIQAAHVYVTPGRYNVVLTVRDASGKTARDSSQVVVLPRTQFSVTSLVIPSNAVAGQPVMFMARTLDADAGALTYVWTFSDGQFATGSQAVAVFPTAGTYLASVSVTDDLGDSSLEETEFDVAAATR
jgi:PKD repeat protein